MLLFDVLIESFLYFAGFLDSSIYHVALTSGKTTDLAQPCKCQEIQMLARFHARFHVVQSLRDNA